MLMSMYSVHGCKNSTVVRTAYGNSDSLEVNVDMHQGSALCLLLAVRDSVGGTVSK